MATAEELEFINRGQELAFLSQCVLENDPLSALVVIRSPTGFGKSRLTDQFARSCEKRGLAVCIVDPSVRAATGTTRLYDGFFLQRCAEALSSLGDGNADRWPSLRTFLSGRRWKTMAEKRPYEAVSELPSFAHAYRVAFDYAARLFGFGRFGSKQLLVSDQADAVRICSDYVIDILTTYKVLLIVRETQHCDLVSLRTLLRLSEAKPTTDLIFEYTNDHGEFEPEHQKQLLRAARIREALDILDLVRLEPEHLEYLVRQNVKSDFHLTSDFYMAWNGNLRSVIELKYRVSIGRRITKPAEIAGVLSNLEHSLGEHLGHLPSVQRMLLAFVLSNVEAIDRYSLVNLVSVLNERTSHEELDAALSDLVHVHRFLSRSDNNFRIQNDSIAQTVHNLPAFRSLIALAEVTLRNFYMDKLFNQKPGEVPLSAAVRQVFRLCAKTKDVNGLFRATETLTDRVNRAQDQTTYIEIVTSALEADPDLYRADFDNLVLWGASLAYDVCDWSACEKLLSLRPHQDSYSLAMRACALQEIGKHDEALQITSDAKLSAGHRDEKLAATLIEAIIAGCRGNQKRSREALSDLVSSPENRESPLLGYVYRSFDVVADYAESLEMLKRSIECFDAWGFVKSKAYSELPAAMLMARLGDVDSGQQLINAVETALAGTVRDQHMVLNNWAAIELLRNQPDFDKCKEVLATALRLARDDYTELTIQTNLALAYWGLNDLVGALECVEKSWKILKNHDFEDKDVYWSVCFNAAQIFAAANQPALRDEILRFPYEHGRPVSVNKSYWAFRYGRSSEFEPDYAFLASRPRHPLYLSHWTIDLEGLSLLKQAPPQ